MRKKDKYEFCEDVLLKNGWICIRSSDVYKAIYDHEGKVLFISDEQMKFFQNHKEEFRLSSKGKVLIAIYSLVVAIILSLIIINSRMLKSLDNSISSYKQKADEINAEVSRIEAEIADITSEETIGEWALKHGMTYHGDAA